MSGRMVMVDLYDGVADNSAVYALSVEHVQQVIESTVLTEVPSAPETVRGIMSYHGRIVTVFDPTDLLEVETPDIENPLVLLLRQEGSANVGMMVSKIRGVIGAESLEPADVQAGPCVDRVAKHDRRLVHIIAFDLLVEALGRQFGGHTDDTKEQAHE